MFDMKKIAAVLLSAAFVTSLCSCDEKADEISSKNEVSQTVELNENGVSDIIEPAEDSEEYDLGNYRISSNGVKLYYDEDFTPTELMLTLEKYFLSFQNDDFESFKSCLAADYVERYTKYLDETFSTEEEEYTLQDSFRKQTQNLKNLMIQQITGEYDISDDTEHTGDFRITRIKAEETELTEGETVDSLLESFFMFDNEIFEMDYYKYITEQADKLHYFTFYLIAEGEDGSEHRIISGTDIVFAEKDGKYYTFG